MKNLFFLVASTLLMISCATKRLEKNRGVSLHQPSATSGTSNKDEITVPAVITRPTEVVLTGDTNHRLITVYKLNFNKSRDDAYTGSNDSHWRFAIQRPDSANVWHNHFMPGLSTLYGYNLFNVANYNIATKTTNNFFDTHVLINTIYYPSLTEDTLKNKPVKRDYYLVSVYDEDTNNDSIINTKDLRRFYKFDLEGKNPVTLIPKNYSVLSSEYDYINDFMYVYARLDENNNGRRELEEPIHIFMITLRDPKAGEIIYK